MRKLLLVSALLLSFAAFSPLSQSIAGPSKWTSAQISKRINIAGRQRMLSQRMSKAVCYAIVGIDADNQRRIASTSAIEFAENLDFLLNGNAEMGGENEGLARVALDDVQSIAHPLVQSTLQLAAGDLHSVPMQLVIERNLPTLQRMNEAVGLIVQAAGGSGLGADVKSTLDLAGRQRMLSQRIAKDMCFINVGMDVDASLADLSSSMFLFQETLRGLIDGNANLGLLAAPTPEIKEQLALVAELWSGVEPAFKSTLNEQRLSQAQMLTVVAEIDQVLVEMNRAVGFWAKHAVGN